MKSREVEGGHFLRIDKGEELVGSITRFAKENGIEAGSITGIGALVDVTIGYFDRQHKEYDKRLIDGEFELVSLTGNVSLVKGEPFVHAHCVLGKPDFTLLGGHLFSGTVAVTGEVFLRVFKNGMTREHVPEFDINLLAL